VPPPRPARSRSAMAWSATTVCWSAAGITSSNWSRTATAIRAGGVAVLRVRVGEDVYLRPAGQAFANRVERLGRASADDVRPAHRRAAAATGPRDAPASASPLVDPARRGAETIDSGVRAEPDRVFLPASPATGCVIGPGTRWITAAGATR
jgi:hypothetical protein